MENLHLIESVFDQARERVRIGMYHFTCEHITKKIIALGENGVQIQIIVDQECKLRPEFLYKKKNVEIL